MPARNAKEAIENVVDTLNATLSCVTDRRLAAFQTSEKLYRILYAVPIPLLTRAGGRFYLQIGLLCTAEQSEDGIFNANTREYSYVFSDSVAPTYHGVVSYHWHPDDFAVREPHLHLRITPNIGYPEVERKIARAHYPTSRVCLEDFIALLIDYYDVKPIVHHSAWKRILRRNKAQWAEQATASIGRSKKTRR